MAEVRGDDRLLAALRRLFGHDSFREGQREIVASVLAGGDVVIVMPTGGGKSLCYQLPAMLDTAPTVVVSPLIALMKDQVDALTSAGLAAAALHSNIDPGTQRQVEAAYAAGAIRLLYVAPERLTRPDLRALLQRRAPARIVVDEAHCISEWGHDFRRDYLRIGEVAADLPGVQMVACTATATPAVRDDIVARLAMRSPEVVVRGFARPELFLAVERVRGEAEKLIRLDELVEPGQGHTIVYAGTRARAAAVAERLGRRHEVMLYHADLPPAARARAQERFASGEVRVAVATSAFGMGVDVATVRQVVHVALPSSLEEYYQQAGRAGRDGAGARCVVVYGPADRRLPEFFIEAAHPDARTLAGVVRSVQAGGGDPGSWRAVLPRDRGVAALSDAAGDAALEILREAGVLDPGGGVRPVDPDHLPVDHGRITRHRRAAYERFGALVSYLAGGRCRHRLIVEHFGETGALKRCGDGCDVCMPAGGGSGATQVDAISVRKALSCVARVNGRVGLSRVAAVLAGSRGKSVTSLPGLLELPTHGALAGWREADIAELLRSLVDAGAIQQGAPPYPVASLTPAGVAAMRGEVALSITDPRRPAVGRERARGGGARDAEEEPLDAAGADVLERLRTWRAATARESDWPAYVVFHDRTLRAIAAFRPGTDDELLRVPGVGPGKLALYGEAVLRLVGASATGTPRPPAASLPTAAALRLAEADPDG